jgi:hypothetical protein
MDGKDGSSVGVLGTNWVKTRALLAFALTVPSFSARPDVDEVSGFKIITWT